jgi:hypothetical protein
MPNCEIHVNCTYLNVEKIKKEKIKERKREMKYLKK